MFYFRNSFVQVFFKCEMKVENFLMEFVNVKKKPLIIFTNVLRSLVLFVGTLLIVFQKSLIRISHHLLCSRPFCVTHFSSFSTVLFPFSNDHGMQNISRTFRTIFLLCRSNLVLSHHFRVVRRLQTIQRRASRMRKSSTGL